MTPSSNPLLIVGYNRADLIIELIEQVHEFDRPIFIWLDGAKNESDSLAIETQELLTRRLREWENENIVLKINGSNFGCGKSLPSAIDWVFEKYDRVIVLEDDVRFTTSFFSYMDWALDYFQDRKEINHINAWNPIGKSESKTLSVYASRIIFGWGWATWRDRWRLGDLQLTTYNRKTKIRSLPTLKSYKLNLTFEKHWRTKLQRCLEGLDAWDYQWQYSIWKNGGFAIMPLQTLTYNIGFDSRATHTKAKSQAIKSEFNLPTSNFDSFEEIRRGSFAVELDRKIELISFDLNSAYSKTYFLEGIRRVFQRICNALR